MGCIGQGREGVEFIATMVAFGVAQILSLVATVCVSTYTMVGTERKNFLFSFSVANVFGVALIIYDTVRYFCTDVGTRLRFLIPILIFLSMSHLILCASVELQRKQPRKTRCLSLNSLSIVFFWSISIVSGLAFIPSHVARITFVALFLIMDILTIMKYVSIRKTIERKTVLRSRYENMYLRGNRNREDTIWSYKFSMFIVMVQIVSSIPWSANEIRESIQEKNANNSLIYSICLVVYSTNIIASSIAFVVLRLKQYAHKRKIRDGRVESTEV